MRIEVLCTGDELLNGTIADTNSPWFMNRLFALGELVSRTTVVGDDRAELVSAMREVSARADAVLVSGGLGPTADDLTAECAAEAAGVPLVEDAGALEALKARFAKRNLQLTPNNARQAMVPKGAEVVLNPVGSAPMFILRLGRGTLFFVPGVPREYQALVEKEVLPRLGAMLEREQGRLARRVRVLKTVRIAESHLDALVMPIAGRHPLIRVGYRTHAPENHLKLLAQAPTAGEAERALAAMEEECRAALGDYVFGADGDELAAVLGARLRERRHTLSVAESATGGLLSGAISAVAGASDYFLGGAVAYSEGLKQAWAKVSPDVLAKHGAVSEEVACQMAAGVREATGSTWALSVTGYAGPSAGTPKDEIGTMFIGLAGPDGAPVAERFLFTGDRDRIRRFGAHTAMDLLRRTLR
ncbi:MAG TPA: CinA family nicotinamide mononucleotide deamidase-related protein [Myxococcales bacterium]|nr:CinA family nicotinamide mononucleotide deamidase-related protein [Myxococcales bacterium]